MQAFEYIFNIGGNFQANINGMTDATGGFTAKVSGAQNALVGLQTKLAVFGLATDYVEKLHHTFEGLSQSGIRLDSQMHDLSAVAGVTGDGLKQIEKYARESAKAFGTDASQAVTGYKLLLSQLTPELGKHPKALQAMGDCIQTTAKLMGNDGAAAAEVLTTAMNQYGVSLDDPMQASREMARMMNVMAAAGQAGSAELPAIKVALEQCGMAAKAANVSFEETNAAIQVLDKAGKKGSEGGVALRNTLAVLSQGRFLPKDTIKELKAAGVDVLALGDKSKTLRERLEMLKPVMNDAALFGKLFGRENANAARALVQGTDALGSFTEAVTGTQSAEEQAAIVMDSFAEKQARARQKVEDFKIALFQATGGLTFYLGEIAAVAVPLAQMLPLFSGLGRMIVWIKGLNFAGFLGGIAHWGRQAAIAIALMNSQEALNNRLSLGFIGNIGRMVIQLVRFATVGVLNAIKGLGALALSFVTTGTASATFSTIAGAAFATFKTAAVSACRAVSVAIMNIPIVGWVAAGIAALVALGVYFWNTSVKFRAILKGLAAAFIQTFKGIWDCAKEVFSAIGNLIYHVFTFQWDKVSGDINKMKNGFSNYGQQIGKAFTDAYKAEVEKSGVKVTTEVEKEEKIPQTITPEIPTANLPDPTLGTTSTKDSSTGADKIRNINIHVDKLIETFTIQTNNLRESAERVKEAVGQALLSALNDTNLAY